MNKTAEERLFLHRNIDLATNCWLWTGAKYKNGYGYIRFNNIKWLVHRLAVFIWIDKTLNKEQQINHKLECKNKNCFNPDHLYIGNQKDNMKDRWSGHKKQSKFITNSNYYRKHNQHRKDCGRT